MMMNPMQVIQMIQRSNNPQQISLLGQAMKMVNGKNPDEARQIAMNMARERNIDIGALANQMGIQLPK